MGYFFSFFDSLIVSILYGCESWSITKVLQNKINSFGTSCYRIMLGIKRIYRIRNDVILQAVNRGQLCDRVFQKQLRALGHWLRKEDSIVKHYALYTPTHGRNRRGRPKLSYLKHIQNISNLNVGELEVAAADRRVWRSTVVGRYDTRPPD